MIIVGIDPGASGGIAWNEPGKGLRAVAMPKSEAEVVAILKGIFSHYRPAGMENPMPIHVFIELVTGYVKPDAEQVGEDGEEKSKNRQPGHTMFTFGRGVGVINGACLMLGFQPIEIHPNVWQKEFFLPRSTKTARKRGLKNAAQRRFPQIKVTLKTCDALLIRDCGRKRLNLPQDAPEPIPAVERGAGRKAKEGAAARAGAGGNRRGMSEGVALDTRRANFEIVGEIPGTPSGGVCSKCGKRFVPFDQVHWKNDGVNVLTLCDACKDYVGAAVYEAQGGQVAVEIGKTPGNGKLFIGDWDGSDFVFMDKGDGKGAAAIRRATQWDLMNIPRWLGRGLTA